MDNDNSSRRGKSSRDTTRLFETERNAELWEAQKKRGRYANGDLYTYANKALADLGATIKADHLIKALEYLAIVTADDVFETARLALLKSYGLTEGGLEAITKRMLRESWTTPMHTAARMMKSSKRREAERVAVQLGLPGTSFETVVRELMRTRAEVEKVLADGEDAMPLFPNGDTGRLLLVRIASFYLNETQDGFASTVDGEQFDKNGFAIVPDNALWRRQITAGRMASFGVLKSRDDPEAGWRIKSWEKLQEISPGK